MSYQRTLTFAGSALAVLAAAVVTGTANPPALTPVAARPAPTALYIVQVDGEPAASYTGGVAGIPATKPGTGEKVDRVSWNYRAYRDHLRTRRAAVMSAAGLDAGRSVAEYGTAFNGFAARLTRAEVDRLEGTAGVARVWKNEIHSATTISTPDLLGLTGATGVWSRRFGNPARAGEGVIVGVVDSGYWPESPSFAELPGPRPDQAVIHRKWYADGVDKCDEGTEEPVACNNKVIGARWYNASQLGGYGPEFSSPRDYNGHGSHTAGTAAGNHGVAATVNGVAVGAVSGMAPAARLAIYKALWQQPGGTGSGGTVDLVQAIDDAVTDGVDVINYSVSGSSEYVVDPVEIAFFHAASAGVFVAASAGNDGPATSSVAHNAPWTMTVAASTHTRSAVKSATLGNGKTYSGVGQGAAVASAPLVDAADAGLSGADPDELALCFPETLDPGKVTGAIVLCKRGVNSRTEKSLSVRDAGGIGMLLYNPTANSLNADYHFVPTVHIGHVEGAAVKAYLATDGTHTASLSATVAGTARAPAVAAFSSTGPAYAGNGDLLKPDVTAPGVDVIAAVAPPGNNDNSFDALSGTSMSSPHVAGVAALLRARYPDWSPSALKSALMTTATLTDNSGGAIQRDGVPATPFDVGAGHIEPGDAFDPGLVYESGPADWIRYGCGIGQIQLVSDFCDTTGSIDPSDLNYPSIAVGDLPGRQTLTRTVTNVSGRASVYVAKVRAPAGFSVKVKPSTLTLGVGRSAKVTIDITRTDSAFDAWAYGSLTWSDLRGHAVRSPIAVRAVAVSAPAEIALTGVSGSKTLTVRGGYSGTLTARGYGLTPSRVHTGRLVGADLGFNPADPKASATVDRFTVDVPARSKVARFSTYDADHAPGTDLDLYVYRDGSPVGVSNGGTSQEAVTLTQPGSYDVYVVQFAVPAGVDEQEVKTHSFVVPPASSSNLSVTPASQRITLDTTRTVTVRWSALATGRRYLGMIEFGDGKATRATTVLEGGTPPY